jgi:carbamoyl-phosphate synthase small subunit
LTTPAVLALQDGTIFRGISVGADGKTIGEVVFNTAMTGYQEILTDPSYCRQIVTLTCSHIGNTGANSDDMESSQVHASGLVVRNSRVNIEQVPGHCRYGSGQIRYYRPTVSVVLWHRF